MGERNNSRNGIRSTFEYLHRSIQEVTPGTKTTEIVFLLVIIPGLMLAIELAILSNFGPLSRVNRDPMWFELSRENYLSAETIFVLYISSFAHMDWNHLTRNLVNYYFCIFALYPISILANRRSLVLKLSIAVFALSPLTVKYVSYTYLTGRTIGFSGILSGLFGLLAVVLFAAVDEYSEADFNPFWSIIMVFAVYTSMLVYFGAFESAGYIVTILIVIIIWFVYREGLNGTREVIEILVGHENIIFPWALIIAYTGAIAMFYGLPPGSNIIGHLGGYMTGWAIGFVILGEGVVPNWALET